MNRLLRSIGFAGASLLASVASALEPELYFSLRGVVDRTVEIGEPIFVSVRIEAAGPGSAPLKVAPASGSWADQISLALVGPSTVRARPAAVPPAGPLLLASGDAATGTWIFDAATTERLAAGEYALQLKLEVRAGEGWTGAVAAEEVALRVVPLSPSGDRAVQRAVAHAMVELAEDRPEAAAKRVDPLLERSPDNIRLLVVRARASAMGGDLLAALTCVQRALDVAQQAPRSHPPIELAELESELNLARLNPVQPKPAPWTRLPARLLAPTGRPAPRPPRAASSGVTGPAASLPLPAPNPPVAQTSPAVNPSAAPASAGVSVVPATASSGVGILVPPSNLDDARIRADPAGQWAATAQARTQYGKDVYSASQATGAPNVPLAGNSAQAWCPATRQGGLDWLELTFARPVPAVEVRVRQTDASGGIAKVEAFEPNGTAHTWWEGVDPHRPAVREIVWFTVRVPRTSYPVARIKLTLNLDSGPGYKQIDAVQLVAAP